MKPNKIKVSKLKLNPNNPRVIKGYKFEKLVKSIQEFPEMLKLRPIVVDENNIILGGNMRYKASVEAGLKEVYTIQADDLTEKQKQEFIIKDNVGFGEWDWDMLANDWENSQLNDWGMDVWQPETNLEDFFKEEPVKEEKEKKDPLEWYNAFIDYIQLYHSNAYNDACKYADDEEKKAK